MNPFIALAAAEKGGMASGDEQRKVLETWAEEGRSAAEAAGHDTPADYLQALLDRAPDEEPPREEDRLPTES